MITLQGALEKSPILLSPYWINEWLNGTIIISYFGGSNKISSTVYLSIYITIGNKTNLLLDLNFIKTSGKQLS